MHMCTIVAAYACTPLLSLSVLERTSTTTVTQNMKRRKS